MLLDSIRAWGSPSGTLLEMDLFGDPLSNHVALIDLDETDHDPSVIEDDSSTDEYPIILGGYWWGPDDEAH
jgi:hypothetical protein